AEIPSRGQVREVVVYAYTVLGDDDRAEVRQEYVGVRDPAVHVGIVADAELEVDPAARGVARFAQPDGVEEAVHRGSDLRFRLQRAQRLELLPRTGVLAEREIAAGELQPRRKVVGEGEHVALEREHALAGMAAVDRRNPEIEIE